MELQELQQLKTDFATVFREFGTFRQHLYSQLGAFHADMCRLILRTESIINNITGDYGPDLHFDARREARVLLGVPDSSDSDDSSSDTDAEKTSKFIYTLSF